MSSTSLSRTVLVFALFLLAGIAQAEEPKPEEIYDFGKGIQGNEIRHDFKIANPGATALVIEKVTTSCPCTQVLSFPQSIAPGKSGVISVRLAMEKVGTRQVEVAAEIKGQKMPRLFVIRGEVWSAP